MINSAATTFSLRLVKTRNYQKPRKNAVWFNKECRIKRKEYLKAKTKHKLDRNEASIETVRLRSKEYKKELFSKKLNKELLKIKSKTPKLFLENA